VTHVAVTVNPLLTRLAVGNLLALVVALPPATGQAT
jgi:hypothetical protein